LAITLNLILGLISGLVSASLIYFYSYQREKARRIIDYAKKTEDRAQFIREEIKHYSESASIMRLKKLIEHNPHRQFAGGIVDKTPESNSLQDAIANCNRVISEIDNLCDEHEEYEPKNTFENKLMHKGYAINDALIDLANAIADYDVEEDRRIMKWHKYAKYALYIGGLIFIVIFLVEIWCFMNFW